MKQWKRYIWPFIWGAMSVLTASQVIASFFLHSRFGLVSLRNVGWIILWVAGFFGVIPIITFHKKGGVPKGQEYVHTAVLVDSGIYAVVRHPQYLSFMLINVGLMLIAQHWLVIAMGAVAVVLNYIIGLEADRAGIEKFGDAYRRYMQKVPRMNFLLGIMRLLRRRKGEQ